MLSQRGHVASLVTLSLEALANKAPEVSFIHNFPGPVKSNIARGTEGAAMFMIKAVFKAIDPLVYMATEESGERHLFLCISATYPAGANADEASGVPLVCNLTIARGTNGKRGSGVYSIGSHGESAGVKVEGLLAQFRKEGLVEMVWKHYEDEWMRITGTEAA